MLKKFSEIKVGEYFRAPGYYDYVWQKCDPMPYGDEQPNCICVKGGYNLEYPRMARVRFMDNTYEVCDKHGELIEELSWDKVTA